MRDVRTGKRFITNHLFSDKKRLSLIKPIEFTSYFRDGVWTMENKDLEVISMSPDYKECLRDFNEEVFFVWEEYGQEDDDKLTNGAKALKRKILRHIRKGKRPLDGDKLRKNSLRNRQ